MDVQRRRKSVDQAKSLILIMSNENSAATRKINSQHWQLKQQASKLVAPSLGTPDLAQTVPLPCLSEWVPCSACPARCPARYAQPWNVLCTMYSAKYIVPVRPARTLGEHKNPVACRLLHRDQRCASTITGKDYLALGRHTASVYYVSRSLVGFCPGARSAPQARQPIILSCLVRFLAHQAHQLPLLDLTSR